MFLVCLQKCLKSQKMRAALIYIYITVICNPGDSLLNYTCIKWRFTLIELNVCKISLKHQEWNIKHETLKWSLKIKHQTAPHSFTSELPF